MIENVLNWIEKSRLIIGLGLIVSIVIGGVYWLYPTQKVSVKPNGDQKVAELEKTVEQLTDRVNELSKDKSAVQASTSNAKTQAPANTADTNKPSAVAGKVNINTATASQLDTLPGIGATYAQRIIDYRTTKGGFKSLSELKNIKGIGDKTFAKLKDRTTID